MGETPVIDQTLARIAMTILLFTVTSIELENIALLNTGNVICNHYMETKFNLKL